MTQRTPKLSPLLDQLAQWASTQWPEPLDAMGKGDLEFDAKCFGAIFRRRARQEPTYACLVADTMPEHLLALSPFIGEIDDQTPGKQGWKAWMEMQVQLWWFMRDEHPPVLVADGGVDYVEPKPAALKTDPADTKTEHLFAAA